VWRLNGLEWDMVVLQWYRRHGRELRELCLGTQRGRGPVAWSGVMRYTDTQCQHHRVMEERGCYFNKT